MRILRNKPYCWFVKHDFICAVCMQWLFTMFYSDLICMRSLMHTVNASEAEFEGRLRGVIRLAIQVPTVVI